MYSRYGKFTMGVHLLGETIDKTRGYYRAQAGKLVRLMRASMPEASARSTRADCERAAARAFHDGYF